MFYDVVLSGRVAIRCLNLEEVKTVSELLFRPGSSLNEGRFMVKWFSEAGDTHTLGSTGYVEQYGDEGEYTHVSNGQIDNVWWIARKQETKKPVGVVSSVDVVTYNTPTGKLAVQVKRQTCIKGLTTYAYTGLYGAGSGHSLEHMRKELNDMMHYHPKMKLVAGAMD